jgi:pyruvate dehydrogenase E2 component (dihydrolipoamide acetyltransferase)
MSESVSLPALGESVTEGTVTRWLKNVGDRVEIDEPLLEVSTDKVDTEIPSPVAGVIEAILVQEDETVEVGTALVTIGDGSAPEAAAPEAAAPAAEAPAAEAPAAEAPAAEAPAAEAPVVAQEAPAQPAESAAPTVEVPAPVSAAPTVVAPSAEQPQDVPASPPVVAEPTAASSEQAQVSQAQAPQAAPSEAPVQAAPPAAAQEAPVEQAQPVASAPVQQAPVAEAPPASAAAAPVAPAHAAPSHSSNAGYVTPIVRKLAHEQGVDLSSVTGTGVGGRIRKQDILEAHVPGAAVQAPESRKSIEISPLRGTTQPMSRLRKVVAERAVISMQSSAQLTSVVEVDVTRVAALRDRVKAEFLEKTGTKLSFLPFFAIAATEALKSYPVVNATIDGDSIVYPDHENLSIAVDTERGLLTPVIRDAGSLDIAGLAKEIADLAERTRQNKLKPDELAGGTFTLTNTGSRGALFDTPIVFLPQVAILGTGIVTKKPVVVSAGGSDAIAIRSTVYLALSYDHRIVDGADAARFLVAVKERLESGDFEADLGI